MNTNNTFPNPFEQDPLPQWDKNEVWDQIEAQLPPNKRRRRVLWCWWLGAGSMVAVALYSLSGWLKSNAPIGSQPYNTLAVVTAEKTIPAPVAQPLQGKKTLKGKTLGQKVLTLQAANPPQNAPLLQETQQNIFQTPNYTPFVPPMAAQNPLLASNLAVNTTTTPTDASLEGGIGPVPAMTTILPAPLPGSITRQTSDTLPHLVMFPTNAPPKTQVQAGFRWLISTDAGTTFRRTEILSSDGMPFKEAHQLAVRPLETAAVQAGLQYQIRPKWAIGAGLRYQSTQHWFQYTETTVQTEQIASDSASFYQFNGVTYFQSGTTTKTTTTTRDIVSPGRMERIFMPVWVDIAFNKRFYGQLGLLLNVHNRYQGFALNPQGTVLAKNDREGISKLYRKSGAHSARVELGYRLVQRGPWQLRAGVHYQADLGSVLRPSTQIRQHDQVLGLTLSILR